MPQRTNTKPNSSSSTRTMNGRGALVMDHFTRAARQPGDSWNYSGKRQAQRAWLTTATVIGSASGMLRFLLRWTTEGLMLYERSSLITRENFQEAITTLSSTKSALIWKPKARTTNFYRMSRCLSSSRFSSTGLQLT